VIWLTTDTHFGHQMLIDKGYRPCGYDSRIRGHLLDLPPSNVLIHLGDVCIGNDEAHHQAFLGPLIYRRIKCWLIRGNHDKKSDSWYLKRGWDFVGESLVIQRHGKRILFTHRPSEHTEDCDVNIHGHLHATRHHDLPGTDHKWLLLALEEVGYRPVRLEKFLARSA